MAHHDDRFCQRRPWSDFIREVGSGGRGSIVSTQRPTYSYVNLQGDFLHRAEIFYIWKKISDFGKKVQLIRNL